MASTASPWLRVGVIGLGIAGGLMVPHLLRHPRATLAGVADPDAELRRRFTRDHAIPAYPDAETLIARDDIDAVYIATPHQLHKTHAMLAAELGKHIVVEKPMALSLADCDAMIDAVERHRVALIVGHTHGFDPAIREIGRIAASESWGPLAMLAMWNYTDFLYRPRRPEELDTAKGGGILFNQIPHHVDIARLLANSPVRSVRAATAILDPRRPTEGGCIAFIDFASGAAATAVYSGYDHFDSDEMNGWVSSTGRKKTPRHGQARAALSAVTGEDARGPHASAALRLRRRREVPAGRARASGPLRIAGRHVREGRRADDTGRHRDLYRRRRARGRAAPATANGRTCVVDELCEAVLDGVPAVHDGRFARGTVEACLAIQASARQRREVFLS